MPDTKKFFAYICLVGGGVGGIMMCEGKKFAICGFALYAIHGTLGLVEMLTKNSKFEQLNRDYTIVLSTALCHGLITTEYCSASGLEVPKSFCLNMICPIIYLLIVYLIKNNDLEFVGDLGHGISVIAMAYYGYDKSQYMAYIVAIFYLIIHFARLGMHESWILSGITSFCAAIAHGVLSISSAYAITQTPHCLFAVIGFVLYFVNGILGIIAYGADSGIKMYKIYSTCLFLGLSLSLPLFVSQLYIDSGFPKSLTLAHFAPFIVSILAGTFKTHDHPVQILYLLSMSYVSIINGRYYGLTTALSFLIAIYAIGPIGMIHNTPSRDLFNYALSFSVYFLILTFKS